MELSGNGVVNKIYEAKMDGSVKKLTSKDQWEEQQARSDFVIRKYKERAFFNESAYKEHMKQCADKVHQRALLKSLVTGGLAPATPTRDNHTLTSNNPNPNLNTTRDNITVVKNRSSPNLYSSWESSPSRRTASRTGCTSSFIKNLRDKSSHPMASGDSKELVDKNPGTACMDLLDFTNPATIASLGLKHIMGLANPSRSVSPCDGDGDGSGNSPTNKTSESELEYAQPWESLGYGIHMPKGEKVNKKLGVRNEESMGYGDAVPSSGCEDLTRELALRALGRRRYSNGRRGSNGIEQAKSNRDRLSTHRRTGRQISSPHLGEDDLGGTEEILARPRASDRVSTHRRPPRNNSEGTVTRPRALDRVSTHRRTFRHNSEGTVARPRVPDQGSTHRRTVRHNSMGHLGTDDDSDEEETGARPRASDRVSTHRRTVRHNSMGHVGADGNSNKEETAARPRVPDRVSTHRRTVRHNSMGHIGADDNSDKEETVARPRVPDQGSTHRRTVRHNSMGHLGTDDDSDEEETAARPRASDRVSTHRRTVRHNSMGHLGTDNDSDKEETAARPRASDRVSTHRRTVRHNSMGHIGADDNSDKEETVACPRASDRVSTHRRTVRHNSVGQVGADDNSDGDDGTGLAHGAPMTGERRVFSVADLYKRPNRSPQRHTALSCAHRSVSPSQRVRRKISTRNLLYNDECVEHDKAQGCLQRGSIGSAERPSRTHSSAESRSSSLMSRGRGRGSSASKSSPQVDTRRHCSLGGRELSTHASTLGVAN
jgi:hypothetical protein